MNKMEAENVSAGMHVAAQVRETILANQKDATMLATAVALGLGVGYCVYATQHGGRSQSNHARKKYSRSASPASAKQSKAIRNILFGADPSSTDSASVTEQTTTASSKSRVETDSALPQGQGAIQELDLPNYGPPEVPQVTSMLGHDINSCSAVTVTLTSPDTATSKDFARWSKHQYKGKAKSEEGRLALPRPAIDLKARERQRVLQEAKMRILAKKRTTDEVKGRHFDEGSGH